MKLSVFYAFWHRFWYFSLKMLFQTDSTSCPPFVPLADSGVTDGANSLAHSCWINIRDKIPARLLMTKMLHTLAPLESLAKMALAWRENNQGSFYFFRKTVILNSGGKILLKLPRIFTSLPQNHCKTKPPVLLVFYSWIACYCLLSDPLPDLSYTFRPSKSSITILQSNCLS